MFTSKAAYRVPKSLISSDFFLGQKRPKGIYVKEQKPGPPKYLAD